MRLGLSGLGLCGLGLRGLGLSGLSGLRGLSGACLLFDFVSSDFVSSDFVSSTLDRLGRFCGINGHASLQLVQLQCHVSHSSFESIYALNPSF